MFGSSSRERGASWCPLTRRPAFLSTRLGILPLKCHGEPEDHKRLYYCNYSQSMGNILLILVWEKIWERSVHSSHLNVKNMWFTPHNVVSTDLRLNLNRESGKNQRNFLNTYNLSDRQFEDVLRLKKCGGKTLGPVVKYSVLVCDGSKHCSCLRGKHSPAEKRRLRTNLS